MFLGSESPQNFCDFHFWNFGRVLGDAKRVDFLKTPLANNKIQAQLFCRRFQLIFSGSAKILDKKQRI